MHERSARQIRQAAPDAAPQIDPCMHPSKTIMKALTRAPGASLAACALTFVARQPIDLARAQAQHAAYEALLRALGLDVEQLPDAPDLPDGVFVEDAAIVVDEVAVMTLMGVAARRQESTSVAAALAPHRRLAFLEPPATIDGGDVLRIGRDIFIGLSTRTNAAAIEQTARLLAPFGYRVQAVAVSGCLHLKTGCSHAGHDTVLINPAWIDAAPFGGFAQIAVDTEEPFAANVLIVDGIVIMPSACPRTAERLASRGAVVRTIDISELAKAEAGLTCMSLIFQTPASRR
jgi:dimethylargininase